MSDDEARPEEVLEGIGKTFYALIGLVMIMIAVLTYGVLTEERRTQEQIVNLRIDLHEGCTVNNTEAMLNNSLGGWYSHQGNIVIKTRDRTPEQVIGTMVHEYAHYEYFELLTEDERVDWELFHERVLNNTPRAFLLLSKYANVSAVESYAWTKQHLITTQQEQERRP